MKKIKYIGVTAAALLAVAPVFTEPEINAHAASESNVQPDTYGLWMPKLPSFTSLPALSKYVPKGIVDKVGKLITNGAEDAAKNVIEDAAKTVAPRIVAAQKAIDALPNQNKGEVIFDNTKRCPDFSTLNNNLERQFNKEDFNKTFSNDYLLSLGFSQDAINDMQAFLSTSTKKYPAGTIQFNGEPNDYAFLENSNAMYKDGGNKSVILKVTFNLPKGADPSESTKISFINTGKPADNLTPDQSQSEQSQTARKTAVTQMNVNYASNITVPAGTKISDLEQPENANVVVMDQNGTPVNYSADIGQLYYTQAGAYARNGKTLDGDELPKQDGAFYQPITLKFDPATSGVNLQAIMASMKQTAQKKGLSLKDLLNQIMKLKDTIHGGLPQQEVPTQKASAIMLNGAGFNPAENYPDYDNNSITFVRTVMVAAQPDPAQQAAKDKEAAAHVNDASNWTITKSNGIVKVGGSIAPLVDDNGGEDNRQLAPGTPWITDEYRTNKTTQEVQYRVSTHEWVSSNDVTSSQTQGNQATGTALTNVQNLSKKENVYLAGSAKKVFKLYRSNGSVSNRGLAGNSAWFTDKSAQDAAGNTYYRVSTDEWIKIGANVTVR